MEGGDVAGADLAGRERLRGVRVPVLAVRREQHELHEDRVRGHDRGGDVSAVRSHERQHAVEDGGAEEDVAIEAKDGSPSAAQAPAAPPLGRRCGCGVDGASPEPDREGEADPFGDDGCERRTFGALLQSRDQDEIQDHVERADRDDHGERAARIPCPNEPAGDDQGEQHGRGACQPDRREGGAELCEGSVGREKTHERRDQCPLCDENADSQGERKEGRALGVGEGGVGAASAKRATYQARCAGAQEAEEPEHRTQDGRAQGGGAQVDLVAEVAKDGRVDEAHQWDGDVRQDRGPRQRERPAVRDGAGVGGHLATVARA